MNFKVEHPAWDAYPVNNSLVDINFKGVYGDDFECLSNQIPTSVLLVEGSEVYLGNRKLIN